ncbi:MAG TPA: hypothetical protein VEZ40_01090 [Pyrinomonadaceae bacterium]|nr:hypothetical protein [Pyrinomonadaceae bacterium]
MRKSTFSSRIRRAKARRGGIAVFCCCALLAAVSLGYAQARRVAKPKNDPPVPKAAETAAPTPEPTPEREKIPLLVGSNGTPIMSRLSMNAGDLLQGAIVQRLRDSKALQVASNEDMTRGEAIKRAKNAETKTHVVWFELQDNSRIYNSDNRRRDDTEDFYIQFIVLEPGTAKVKAQGTVHLRPTSSSRIGGIGVGRSLPRCYPQGLYNVDFALVEAGIELAERIFQSFSLPNPAFCS